MADYDESSKTASDLVLWARQKMATCLEETQDWRSETTESYGLVAGDQWDPTVRNDLEADQRPIFTFNRVAGFIRGICGLETSTRSAATVFAREVNDSGVADVRNAAIRYVRESCDADDEESDAFKDMLICGLGWTETLFTTEEDPEGEIVIERVDPAHMRWDTSARKRGLADRRWNARIKWLPYETIRDVWGKKKADEIAATATTDTEFLEDLFGKAHDATEAHNYEAEGGNIVHTKNIPVVQFQYVKTAYFMSFTNPLTGSVEEVSEDDYDEIAAKFAANGIVLDGARVKHRQYRQLIYSGGTELEEAELPCRGFTFNPITGIRDRNNGSWYGFIRDLMDPQRWINKFFSSMADVVASQAKGGLLAEADAFVDKANAENDWANPRSIVWLKRDGLQKIKERTNAGVPAGLNQLLDFTVASLPQVAGVNLEFLGMASREQPGVLEHQRKQAAIATLAEFFNALRLYRKQQTRVLLQFIDEFISDNRLIRIVGTKDARYVQLARAPGTLKYDIVVDEAPTSPDQKERTWIAMQQLLPVAANLGLPVPPQVLEYAPLPRALVDDWLKYAEEQGGMSPQAKAQMQQMQEQLGALQKENQTLKTKQQENMAKLQMDQAEGQQKLQLQEQETQANIQLKIMELQANIQLKSMEIEADMAIERAKAAGQMQLQQESQAAQLVMQSEQQGQENENRKQEAGANESALQALTAIMEKLVAMQAAPRTISDGKGRSFTVKQGE
jgi:hypothetical protein